MTVSCCVVIFIIGVHAGHAASPCLNQETTSKSQLSKIAEIRLLKRLTAKLTDDLRLLESAQGSNASAVQKNSSLKYSLLQQKIQSLERRKTLLLADKNANLSAAQKSSPGRQISINPFSGSISGTVSYGTSPVVTPVENVYVLAFDLVTMEDAYTVASPLGSYVIDNLPDSDYYVFFDGATVSGMSCNYGYYDAHAANNLNIDISQADLVAVAGSNTILDDVTLTCSGSGGGGSIKGTMSGDFVGIPGHVDVYDENYKWVAYDRIEVTDNGQYEVTGLDASKKYKLFF